MNLILKVYYNNNTSELIEIEKPAGAHPDSIAVLAEGILVAEKSGRRVSKIGRLSVNQCSFPPFIISIADSLPTRKQVLEILQKKEQPMNEKYKALFD